jgi:hypothetical protein
MTGESRHQQPSQTGVSSPSAAFRYTFNPSLADLLEGAQSTFLVFTYQAGKLIAVRASAARSWTLLRTFDHAMGGTACASVRLVPCGTGGMALLAAAFCCVALPRVERTHRADPAYRSSNPRSLPEQSTSAWKEVSANRTFT